MPELSLKSISIAFDKTSVLESISLGVPDGSLLVLLGSSGCGKTTLLRLIAGLEECDSGEIYLDNRRVDHLRPKERNVAMVFQNYSLYPHMSVRQNLAFPLKVAGAGKEEIKKRVSQTADTLGLSDRLDYRPSQLSGGQRQRVALGRAIIRQPDLFLLDEPLSNLDADLRVRMRREIVRIQKSLGVTTVYVTHDQEEALTMADQIALMHNGKIEQIASPKALYENPSTLYAAQFVGSPRINVIDARIERHLLLPFGLSLLNDQLPRDCDRVTVGLRPEQIKIGPGGEYQGKVEAVEFLGDQYVAELDFQQNSLKVSGLSFSLEIGQEVSFSVNSKNLLFFDPSSGKRFGSS